VRRKVSELRKGAKPMDDLPNITRCSLFAGIAEQDLGTLLACLSCRRQAYEKGGYILLAGTSVVDIGIVLSGRALALKEDFWGNRTILFEIEPSGLFAESFSCAGNDALPLSVMATETTEVLFLDYRRVVSSCTSACVFHTTLIQNMLQIVARNNIALVEKIEHITKRSTRKKLLSYLSEQARLKGSHSFEIPFDRQELADYLAVDRSAMTVELSRMRDAGLLRFNKNSFELLSEP